MHACIHAWVRPCVRARMRGWHSGVGEGRTHRRRTRPPPHARSQKQLTLLSDRQAVMHACRHARRACKRAREGHLALRSLPRAAEMPPAPTHRGLVACTSIGALRPVASSLWVRARRGGCGRGGGRGNDRQGGAHGRHSTLWLHPPFWLMSPWGR